MRKLLILFFTGLLLLAVASNAWASAGPVLPKDWQQVHHPIHIRGKIHKGIHPALSSSGGGYTPAQISHAYGIDRLSNTGAGQTVAIIEAYGSPTISADLAAFDNEYSLPAANLTIAYPNGQPTIVPTSLDEEGWAQETSLDVEWVHALAPSANILLVVALYDNGNSLFNAVQYANAQNPQIVSMSWDEPDPGTSIESHYDTACFSHSGTLYLAASGDSGAGAQYPASSSNVIAVGGTSLPLNANGSLNGPETAWSNSSGSSGGGISNYEAQPSWQTSFGVSFSSSKRCIPDVAFDADPNTGVNVYFDSSKFDPSGVYGAAGWYAIGGTSLSVQCWAAIMALADQNSRVTNASPLYELAGSQGNFNPGGAYRDITSGNNGGYSAGVGYDLVTGLGSPVANVLVPSLGIAFSPVSGSAITASTPIYITVSPELSVTEAVYWNTTGPLPTSNDSLYQKAGLTLSPPGTVYAAVYDSSAGSWSDQASATYTIVPPTVSVTGVALNDHALNLTLGETTAALTATVTPSNATNKAVTWGSSNAGVATVNNGVVTPVAMGTAIITVTTTDSSKTDTCTVTVNTIPVTSITVLGANSATSLENGSALQMNASVLPANATDSNIVWSVVSETGTATISSNGMLTATGVGVVTVTATNAASGVTGTENITITTAPVASGGNSGSGGGGGGGGVITPVTSTTSVTPATSVTTITPVVPIAPVAPITHMFSDVATSYWGYGAISNLSGSGYISGYPDGTFKPDNQITRAEFCAIMDSVLNLTPYTPQTSTFNDINTGDWFDHAVETAVHAGIANGYGDGTFQPNAPISRQEMACILVQALGKQTEAQSDMNHGTVFTDDASISSWARGFVVMAANDALLKGYPDNSFQPQGNATRAEACTMIVNLLSIQK